MLLAEVLFNALEAVLAALGFVGRNDKARAARTVRILINAERTLKVPRGGVLLYALANEGIVLPTTCGGTGSCAKCKCMVTKGGGHITPQELPYFSKAQVKEHWRLACQVRLVRDLAIEVPVELLHPKQPGKVS